jgi:hypothetical protein
MTAMMETDLQRKYTAEERDTMFEAFADACGIDDHEEIDRLLSVMPINPRWAKIIAKVMGKEYLRQNFNITYANEVYGEGWLNAE